MSGERKRNKPIQLAGAVWVGRHKLSNNEYKILSESQYMILFGLEEN